MPISGAVYSVIQVIGFKATHGAKYPIFLNLLIYLNYLLFPNDIMSFLTDTNYLLLLILIGMSLYIVIVNLLACKKYGTHFLIGK